MYIYIWSVFDLVSTLTPHPRCSPLAKYYDPRPIPVVFVIGLPGCVRFEKLVRDLSVHQYMGQYTYLTKLRFFSAFFNSHKHHRFPHHRHVEVRARVSVSIFNFFGSFYVSFIKAGIILGSFWDHFGTRVCLMHCDTVRCTTWNPRQQRQDPFVGTRIYSPQLSRLLFLFILANNGTILLWIRHWCISLGWFLSDDFSRMIFLGWYFSDDISWDLFF